MTQDEDEDEDGSSFVAISKFRCAIYMAMKKKKYAKANLCYGGKLVTTIKFDGVHQNGVV